MKWPNDVVVDDRKLAGILAEADGAGAVVVGMGLNVRGRRVSRPSCADIATACDLHSGDPVDRVELLVAWLRALDARLDDARRRRRRGRGALGDARPAGARRARPRARSAASRRG